MSAIPGIPLNNGVVIPQIGFGVFEIAPTDAQRMTEHAFEVGYRHVDTAAGYRNESGVGRAVIASGLPREDVFVTTKLWNADQGYESALAAFDSSLHELGLDYIDLYLIHFPAPTRLAYADTWRALEKLYRDGLIRAIGVSNFKFPFLDRLLRSAEIVPAVHQIEVHPTYQQAELDQLTRDHGIVVEAYSPLGRAADLAEPQIGRIAEAHGVTPAQVILRWHLQAGRVPLPKSESPERIANNIDLVGFALDEVEMGVITSLERGLRTGEDVETFN